MPAPDPPPGEQVVDFSNSGPWNPVTLERIEQGLPLRGHGEVTTIRGPCIGTRRAPERSCDHPGDVVRRNEHLSGNLTAAILRLERNRFLVSRQLKDGI